jgi:integrase
MITARSSPSTVNQALAAVTLMYEQAGLRIAVKRVRIPRPGEPGALTRQEEAALRRAASRRGPRDSAIIAVLLDAGARVQECARLDAGDFAITARTGEVRLHGKGDEVRSVPLSRRARELVSAWLDVRGRPRGLLLTRERAGSTWTTEVTSTAFGPEGVSLCAGPGRSRRGRHHSSDVSVARAPRWCNEASAEV